MTSRHKWKVNGKAVHVRERKFGWWITVKGSFSTDCFDTVLQIDCWLPSALNDRRRNFWKKFTAEGKLVFENNDCYFIVDRLI